MSSSATRYQLPTALIRVPIGLDRLGIQHHHSAG